MLKHSRKVVALPRPLQHRNKPEAVKARRKKNILRWPTTQDIPVDTNQTEPRQAEKFLKVLHDFLPV